MSRLPAWLLALAAAPPALLAVPTPEVNPPAPPSVDGRAATGETMIMNTDSGQLRWSPGSPDVEVLSREGKPLRRIRLPRSERKPGKNDQVTLRALLPPRGNRFLAVEETRREIGLHLAERRGEDKPKATVVRSVLRLVDESSRVLWERPTEAKTAVGGRADAQHLQIAPGGTVAILLEDVDPYTKNRPALSVIDGRGREALRLDYTAWQRIDEFALSADGRLLAVHGFGVVPEDGAAGRALGYYQLGKGALWIKALPRMADAEPRLEVVNADGWICCVQTPDGWSAFDRAGTAAAVGADEMSTRFGVKP